MFTLRTGFCLFCEKIRIVLNHLRLPHWHVYPLYVRCLFLETLYDHQWRHQCARTTLLRHRWPTRTETAVVVTSARVMTRITSNSVTGSSTAPNWMLPRASTLHTTEANTCRARAPLRHEIQLFLPSLSKTQIHSSETSSCNCFWLCFYCWKQLVQSVVDVRITRSE